MCTVPGSLALRPPWRGTAAPFSGEETGAQSQDAEPGLPGLSGRATAPCSLPWSGPESVGNYRTEVLPFGFHVGGKKPKGTCGCRPGPAEASHSPVGTPEASPGLPGSPRQRPWNAPGGGARGYSTFRHLSSRDPARPVPIAGSAFTRREAQICTLSEHH